MFWRKKAELQNQPPSRAAFLKGVKRTQYQFIIWKSAPDINPDKPMPDNNGWKWECNKYISVMTTLPFAPEAPLQLIDCGCSKSLCEPSRCKSKAYHLYCTDLCCCGADEDP